MKSLRHVLNASTVVFLGLMMLFANISVAQSEQAYWPTAEWRTSSPEQQLLNKEILKKLKKRIRRNEIADIDSLIIVRNGYLVVEEYFRGWGPNDLHTLQSVSKSISLFRHSPRSAGVIV